MIDEKLIEELAGKEFEARMVMEGMRQMNVAGLLYEERKQQAIDYAKARANHFDIKKELENAIFCARGGMK